MKRKSSSKQVSLFIPTVCYILALFRQETLLMVNQMPYKIWHSVNHFWVSIPEDVTERSMARNFHPTSQCT